MIDEKDARGGKAISLESKIENETMEKRGAGDKFA